MPNKSPAPAVGFALGVPHVAQRLDEVAMQLEQDLPDLSRLLLDPDLSPLLEPVDLSPLLEPVDLTPLLVEPDLSGLLDPPLPR